MATKCLFCQRDFLGPILPNKQDKCPYCGVIITASQHLPASDAYPEGLGLPEYEPWEARMTVAQGLYLQFYWNPEELLTTSKVAQILNVTSPRSVSRMIRNGFLPNAVREQRGTVGIRYRVPRKDVLDYLLHKQGVSDS